MEVEIKSGKTRRIEDEILALGIFEKDDKLDAVVKEIDLETNNSIKKVLESKDFKGKLSETYLIPNDRGTPAKRILLVGLGKKEEFKLDTVRQVSATVAKFTKGLNLESFTISLFGVDELKLPLDVVSQAIVEGAILALYKFDKYKTEKEEEEEETEIKKISIFVKDPEKEKLVQKGAEVGKIVSEATILAKDIANESGDEASPLKIAEIAKKVARENNLKCEVLQEEKLRELGMGGILGVAQGSEKSPCLVVLEYNAEKNLDTVAIVGKGVTFDSGGISLKPYKGMADMKSDKSGAADVLSIMQVVAKLNLPLRVIGLMPLTENMPGGAALKPGDIIKTYSGKTVEVLNTDAEGRLILADALSYASKYKPKLIIDLATLTGACIIALGYNVAGLLGNDQEIIEKIKKAGDITWERVWQFPLWDDYKEMIKSDVADIKNVGSEAGDASTITAAAFLEKFVGEAKWVHLDTAGPSILRGDEKTPSKGATGFGVRLIVQFLRDLVKEK